MINTVFLDDEDFGFKSFSNILNPKYVDTTKLSVCSKLSSSDQFTFSSGRVHIPHANEVLCLEHIPGNVDIVLPKPERVMDWVVLLYNQHYLIDSVSYDNRSNIKVYGNGKRIMGLDEPMVCDVPFMSLKLTYVNDVDGWIVI